MTETEWLACTDPTPMLQHLDGKASERKLTLFICGCSRHIWHLLTDRRRRKSVEIAEQYAEGTVSLEEFRQASQIAGQGRGVREIAPTGLVDLRHALDRCRTAAFSVWNATQTASTEAWDRERNWQCSLLRDIFGTPLGLQPLLDTSWLTSTVRCMARVIYEEREFEHLPIMADALEDAGCTNADILDHCRQPGPHVRGCWVVDLLTGRS